jgi:hypothetical protein
MRDDENPSSTKGKARKAFYPKKPTDEAVWSESFYSLQKAPIEEEPEEGRRKAEIWHIFETW